MNGEERRHKLIDHLREGVCSAPDLASWLGVTERTVLRDVAYLQARGIAIERRRGRHGGFKLNEQTRVRVELTPGQVRELVAALLFAATHQVLLTSGRMDRGARHRALVDTLLGALPARRERGIRKLLLSQEVPWQNGGFRSDADLDELEHGVLAEDEVRLGQIPKPGAPSFLGVAEPLELDSSGWHVPIRLRYIGQRRVRGQRRVVPVRDLWGGRYVGKRR